MKERKLPDSELKIMSIVWDAGSITAKEASEHATSLYNWKKNTAYTIIGNLVTKGLLLREDPGFHLTALAGRTEVAVGETKSLLNTFYHGSVSLLFSCLMENNKLSSKEIENIQKIIDGGNV